MNNNVNVFKNSLIYTIYKTEKKDIDRILFNRFYFITHIKCNKSKLKHLLNDLFHNKKFSFNLNINTKKKVNIVSAQLKNTVNQHNIKFIKKINFLKKQVITNKFIGININKKCKIFAVTFVKNFNLLENFKINFWNIIKFTCKTKKESEFINKLFSL